MKRSLVLEQPGKLPEQTCKLRIPHFVMLSEAKHLSRSFSLGETGMAILRAQAELGNSG
jgi:hypothetical protein